MTLPQTPQPRRIEVRGDAGILFCYYPDTEAIEVKRGEFIYLIPIWQLHNFAKASLRNQFQAYTQELPCGHEAGTVFNIKQKWVCAICGQ